MAVSRKSKSRKPVFGAPFWNVCETAQNLKISEVTVRRKLHEGILRRYKFGRRTLISAAQALSTISES